MFHCLSKLNFLKCLPRCTKLYDEYWPPTPWNNFLGTLEWTAHGIYVSRWNQYVFSEKQKITVKKSQSFVLYSPKVLGIFSSNYDSLITSFGIQIGDNFGIPIPSALLSSFYLNQDLRIVKNMKNHRWTMLEFELIRKGKARSRIPF